MTSTANIRCFPYNMTVLHQMKTNTLNKYCMEIHRIKVMSMIFLKYPTIPTDARHMPSNTFLEIQFLQHQMVVERAHTHTNMQIAPKTRCCRWCLKNDDVWKWGDSRKIQTLGLDRRMRKLNKYLKKHTPLKHFTYWHSVFDTVILFSLALSLALCGQTPLQRVSGNIWSGRAKSLIGLGIDSHNNDKERNTQFQFDTVFYRSHKEVLKSKWICSKSTHK